MAAGGTSFVKTRRIQGFTALLRCAACEWFLIFLLLVDGVLSYLLTKFASYCQLQAPCMLCSRLDRVLGGENTELFGYEFCSNHRSEISSLILCHIHGKVAKGHGMCDDCLLSVTTKTELNPEVHRLLVGKLGLVLRGCGFQSPLVRKELITGSKGSRTCTCCGKLWKSGQNIQLKSPGRAILKPYIPLPHVPCQSHLKHHDSKLELRCDPLSHVGYTELKLNSDTKSDFPFSDDDSEGSMFRENIELTSVNPPKSLPSDLNPANPNSNPPNPMPLLLDPSVKPHISKHHYVNEFLDSDAVGGINWQQTNQKSLTLSLDEVSPLPNVVNISNGESEEAVDVTQATGAGLVYRKPEEDLRKISTSAKATIETDPIVNDSTLRTTSPRHGNSSNMSKSSVTTKETEILTFVIEQPSTEEELKLTASRVASPYGSHISSFVPINHVHYPEIQAQASISNGTQVLQKSASVESALESLDGSNVCRNEGESTVDRLKRQIEYDKKCINALYKELEEERNAVAIAADQAMAMITRLQEEKAALHMEAVQHLRMMEEQAEYDRDALEKVNDLLAEKEKEIQDLEAEIEWYKENMTDEPIVHCMHKENCDLKADNVIVQNVSSDAKIAEVSKVSAEAVAVETSSLEFEEEKLFISQCLTSLEKKLHQIYCNGISSNMPNGRAEKHEDNKLSQQRYSNGEGQTEETDFSIRKNIGTKGCLTDQDDPVASDSEENSHFTSVGPKLSMTR